MAVVIVDEKPDPNVVKQVVCRSCGVKLEYLPIDVKEYSGTDYGGGPDGKRWIECPKCSKQVILESEIAPMLAAKDAEIERFKKWVADLYSGMYINCEYCGHRYGPRHSTPDTMVEVLRRHVEQCPEHPLSLVTAERDRLAEQVERLTAEVKRLERRNAELTVSEDAMASKLRVAESARKMVCGLNQQQNVYITDLKQRLIALTEQPHA